jgi:UDP-glucose 4-epimerase
MKKVIVTGGAGYIGSHTVVELIKSGYEPIIFDNYSNSSKINIDGIKKICNYESLIFHHVDCTNLQAMNKIASTYTDLLAVIHFAAYKSVGESVQKPKKYHDNNVGSMKSVLQMCKDNNIQNLIFSSSCTVYGNPKSLPVDETFSFGEATSPYGETKQICERLLEKDTINSISLRYFNPIGAHDSTLIGDLSRDNLSNLVPILTAVAAGYRDELLIYGDNYNTDDGSCLRDYIHVQDLADSHIKALDYLLAKKGKSIFNIGTGEGLSVFEAVKIFEKSNKLELNKRIVNRREGDIESIYSSCEKANSLLGWKSVRSVKQAMIDAWNWEQYKAQL